jgi:hydroxypyruvate reductase
MNCVRKHLFGIKGGAVAACAPARVVTLTISDVSVTMCPSRQRGPRCLTHATTCDALADLQRYRRAPLCWRSCRRTKPPSPVTLPTGHEVHLIATPQQPSGRCGRGLGRWPGCAIRATIERESR